MSMNPENEKVNEYIFLSVDSKYVLEDKHSKIVFDGQIERTVNAFEEQARNTYETELYRIRHGLTCVYTVDNARRNSVDFNPNDNNYIEITEVEKDAVYNIKFKSNLSDICIFVITNEKVKLNLVQYSKKIIIEAYAPISLYISDGKVLFQKYVDELYNREEDIDQIRFDIL